jgi:PAS domain-containing protein
VLTTPVTDVVHLHIASGGSALRVLRDVAAGLELGVAAYDGRLSALWANAVMRRRVSELTERGGDEALTTLFGGSAAFPRWTRFEVASAIGDLPCMGVELERGRAVLRLVVVPCVDCDGGLDALVLLAPDEGPGPLESLPTEPASWRRALDRCRIAVAATPAEGGLRVLGGGDATVLAGLRDSISTHVRSASRSAVEESDRRFREGSAVAGDEAVSVATPEGGLARGRLVWATLVDGSVPRVRLDVFSRTEEAVDGTSTADHIERLVLASPDALVLVDGRRVVAASPAVTALFGRVPEHLVGEDLAVLAPPGDGRLDVFASRLAIGVDATLRAVVGVLDPQGRRCEVELHAAGGTDAGCSSVVVARRTDGEFRAGLELSRIAAMLAVADLATDDGGRLRGALELVREELAASWVELVHVDDRGGTVLESYREPPCEPDGTGAVQPVRRTERLIDWARLLAGSSGPLVVDPETGVPGSLEHGEAPPLLIAGVPTASTGTWILVACCEGPVGIDDAPRTRRAAQAVGWVVDRVTTHRRLDGLVAERDLLAAAVDVASPGLLVSDPELVVRVANRGAGAAFGTDGERLAGRRLPELFVGGTVDRIQATLEGLVHDGGSWQGRFEGRTRFDRDARLYLRVDPVVRPDGTPLGLVTAVWDLDLQAAPVDD